VAVWPFAPTLAGSSGDCVETPPTTALLGPVLPAGSLLMLLATSTVETSLTAEIVEGLWAFRPEPPVDPDGPLEPGDPDVAVTAVAVLVIARVFAGKITSTLEVAAWPEPSREAVAPATGADAPRARALAEKSVETRGCESLSSTPLSSRAASNTGMSRRPATAGARRGRACLQAGGREFKKGTPFAAGGVSIVWQLMTAD
jgi:hypothetical protein